MMRFEREKIVGLLLVIRGLSMEEIIVEQNIDS